MDPKSYEVPEFFNKIEDITFHADLPLIPNNPPNYDVSNKVIRALGYNLGYTGKLWVPLRSSDSGALKTTLTGSSYQSYEVYNITGGVGAQVHTFSGLGDVVLINITAGINSLEIANASLVYGNSITLPNYGVAVYQLQTKSIRLTSSLGSSAGQIIIFY